MKGLALEKRFERYHRVLSKAKWNEFSLSKILLGLLIVLLPHGASILIAIDETIERRSGKKISTKGCYRDACRSSQILVIKLLRSKMVMCGIVTTQPLVYTLTNCIY